MSVATGLLVDRALGEPPAAVHPVAAFGRAMQRLEARTYADSRARGSYYALVGMALFCHSSNASRGKRSETA